MKEYTYFTITGINDKAFETVESAIEAAQTACRIGFSGCPERITDYAVMKNTICKNGWIKREEIKQCVTDYAIQMWKKDIEHYTKCIKECKAKIENIKVSTKYKNETNKQKAIQKEKNNIKVYREWINNIKERIAD